MPIYDVVFERDDTPTLEALNEALRGGLGGKISGMSQRKNRVTEKHMVVVHFHVAQKEDSPAPADVAVARDIVEKHGVLVVDANKASVVADGVDVAVVSCNDGVIGSDVNVVVTVWLDGEEYMAPLAVPLGDMQGGLNLKTEFAGEYLVEVKRMGAGNYETGYVIIQATEGV